MREVIHYSDDPAGRRATVLRIRDRLRARGVKVDDECKACGDIRLEVQIRLQRGQRSETIRS